MESISGDALEEMLIPWIALLCHYHKLSLLVNPWQIRKISYKVQRLLNSQGLGSESNTGLPKEGDSSPSPLQKDDMQSVLFTVLKELADLNTNTEVPLSVESLYQYLVGFFKDRHEAVEILKSKGLDRPVSDYMRRDVQIALSNSIIRQSLALPIVKFLSSNSDLLTWEYLRCLGQDRNLCGDPFVGNVVNPVPYVYQVYSNKGLSMEFVLWWAEDVVGLAMELASRELDQIFILGGVSNTRLSFTAFIMFALRCFYCVARTTQTGLSPSQIMQVASRNMLNKFSQRLSKLQQAVRVKLLQPFMKYSPLQSLSTVNVDEVVDNESLIQSVFAIIDAKFADAINTLQHRSSSNNSRNNNINDRPNDRSPSSGILERGTMVNTKWLAPPRPPLMSSNTRMWDIARLSQAFHFIGLVEHFGNICNLWKCFASLNLGVSDDASLVQTEIWVSNVKPTPFMVDEVSFLTLLSELLQAACTRSVSNGTAATKVGHWKSQILSTFVAYEDMRLSGSEMAISGGSTIDYISKATNSSGNEVVSCYLFEDIVRYGGSASMKSLIQMDSWLQSLYTKLCETVQAGALSINLCCRVLSCYGLLSLGIVAKQAKRSLYSRLRLVLVTSMKEKNSHDKAEGQKSNVTRDEDNEELDGTEDEKEITTMNYAEFEHLMLRCAYLMWCTYGYLGSRGVPTTYERNDDVTAATDLTRRNLLDRYNYTCGSIVKSSTSNTLWGTDFLYPYLEVLESMVQCEMDYKLDLCAYLRLPRGTFDSFRKKKAVQNSNNSGNNDSKGSSRSSTPIKQQTNFSESQSFDYYYSYKQNPLQLSRNQNNAPPILSDQTFMQENDLNDLKTTDEVISRSSELIEGILNSRTDSPLQASYNVPGVAPGRATAMGRVRGSNSNPDLQKVFNNESNNGNSNGRPVVGSGDEIMSIAAREDSRGILQSPLLGGLNSRDASPKQEDRGNGISSMQMFDKIQKGAKKSNGNPSLSGSKSNSNIVMITHEGDNDNINSISDVNRAAAEVIHQDSNIPKSPSNNSVLSDTFHIGGSRDTTPPRNGYGSDSSDGAVVFHPAGAQIRNSPLLESPTRALLEGTKEALWPMYGTYCSCGDSNDPGKLSGPNLFALLSKLGVLTNNTVISDIGILLHQISAHTQSSSVSVAITAAADAFESPSLSFEEFLVFLSAFAQLRFDGVVSAPILSNSKLVQEKLAVDRSGDNNLMNTEVWFKNWKTFLGSSQAFRRLMEENVLPTLKKYPLLAFPEDARHRDRYAAVFSLEVLLAIETCEDVLMNVFEGDMSNASSKQNKRNGTIDTDSILNALQRIELVPAVVNEAEVRQLIKDVTPSFRYHKSKKNGANHEGQISAPITSPERGEKDKMIFPQWEWVICLVAFQAVEKEMHLSKKAVDASLIPGWLAEIITSIAKNI